MGPWDIITFVDFQDFPAPQFPSLVRDPCLTISTSPRFAAKCLGVQKDVSDKHQHQQQQQLLLQQGDEENVFRRILFKHKLLHVIFFGTSIEV